VETVLGVQRLKDDNWDYWLDSAQRIAYIRINSFAQATPKDLARALNGLKSAGMKGLVLDLRFCPGGLLTTAIQIADAFLGEELILTTRDRAGKEYRFGGSAKTDRASFPLAVLINGQTAAGSEIVAACLQDHGRAAIVGERSYGVGSVQTITDFDGGFLRLTTAYFFRPNGANLDKASTSGSWEDPWGVLPDPGYLLNLSAKERDDLADYQASLERIKPPGAPSAPATFKDRQRTMALEYLLSAMERRP
jgi:C-terminal peptidase prc